MNAQLNRVLKNERGVTALETAIILIAFVVVAAIFAFTVLSTGTFLTEKSKEAAYAGLQEVRGSMKLAGSMVATGAGGPPMNVISVELTLATAAGGASVDLSTGAAGDLNAAKVQFTFHDADTNQILTAAKAAAGTTASEGTWGVIACTNCQPSSGCEAAGNCILSTGGLARISIGIPTAAATKMTAYHVFAIEVKPPSGGTMLIQRTLPAEITTITDLK